MALCDRVEMLLRQVEPLDDAKGSEGQEGAAAVSTGAGPGSDQLEPLPVGEEE